MRFTEQEYERVKISSKKGAKICSCLILLLLAGAITLFGLCIATATNFNGFINNVRRIEIEGMIGGFAGGGASCLVLCIPVVFARIIAKSRATNYKLSMDAEARMLEEQKTFAAAGNVRADGFGYGAKDTIYCKYCGEVIDADSMFCKACGRKQV
ncbi:MAG: hypothetical protein LBT55_07230 [Clostridiaceae bacterium]|jgi:hypothetical protein|nr:hypothetical protein [Clostridiaceae bacterium]